MQAKAESFYHQYLRIWRPLAEAKGRKEAFLFGAGAPGGNPCLLTNVCIYEMLPAWIEHLLYN